MGNRKRCTEDKDRISELPDTVLCHILSFVSTVEAVKTSVLSHRWEKLWASVPIIDVCDYSPKKFRFDAFSLFLEDVLFAHANSKVHRFRICCTKMVDPSLFDHWINTAIDCNVAELDLSIVPLVHSSVSPQCFELPTSLFLLKSLEVLKLSLQSFISITPDPKFFPSLKFLHVSVSFVTSHLMENLFTCCPVLEELIFDGNPGYNEDDSVFNVNISAPKLKVLQIALFLEKYVLETVVYEHKLFINANAPNLEKFTFDGNLLAVYSSSNAKSLIEAKIDFADLHADQEPAYLLDAADLLHRLFLGISNVTYLSISAPIFGDPDIVHHYRLPTFSNLKHMELLLQACCTWQPLISFLNASPKLESLVLKKSRDCLGQHPLDELHHDWNPPGSVPTCLSSQLKTVCIRGFRGHPDQMKVAEYLLKHGEVLNKVTVYLSSKAISSEKVMKQGFKKLPRSSKTCQIEFPSLPLKATSSDMAPFIVRKVID